MITKEGISKFKQACENQPQDPDQPNRLKKMQDMKMREINLTKRQLKKIEDLENESDKRINRRNK